MAQPKPPLARLVLRHHLVSAAITLGVVMLVLLIAADRLAFRATERGLSAELQALAQVEDSMEPMCGMGGLGHGRVERIVLDMSGRCANAGMLAKLQDSAPAPGNAPGLVPWERTAEVLKSGQLQGSGKLPWIMEPVVWAAKTATTTDGEPRILVAWSRMSSIRAATSTAYATVILVTLVAFAASAFLIFRATRELTSVIGQVSESAKRMAKGDFQIRLPEQTTAELDDMATAVTALASDLDQTTVALQAEHQRLSRLEEMQRQFVADASHELRAPLTSMSLTLDTWCDGLLKPEKQPEALVQLRRESKRLGHLVTGLLDLSRIESGRERINIEPMILQDVMVEVAESFAWTPTGPSISVDVPDTLPRALADRDALYRVLRNLVENALRFTEPTGQVVLWANADGGELRLGVTDTGCGIAPEDLPRIWDRFSRAESARATGKAGSGLGLAIVKALVSAMDGEVRAESTVGHGTTIWMRLRRADA
ncbi:MAG: sensor histidine kinase [Armatimonadota bacterium]